jgi:hypothetical protein
VNPVWMLAEPPSLFTSHLISPSPTESLLTTLSLPSGFPAKFTLYLALSLSSLSLSLSLYHLCCLISFVSSPFYIKYVDLRLSE